MVGHGLFDLKLYIQKSITSVLNLIITVKHLLFARTKFRECRTQAIREHVILANRGSSQLSKTLYGLKIGPLLRILWPVL